MSCEITDKIIEVWRTINNRNGLRLCWERYLSSKCFKRKVCFSFYKYQFNGVEKNQVNAATKLLIKTMKAW